ncbi:MAG: acetyl-CoA carboxylase carboxyltransferase subunit alpha [Acidobacteria bacterium]|nr:acetyl-CoA carboxylase carboxyltransferase subunit alpha [Acidobacteriota bacterium]MCZ6768158.1 acetyl-CoA carboxylase carboxyltransferase subunit alpha [Acidobacteriota bacterium]
MNSKVKELTLLKERVEELPSDATSEIATLQQLIARLEADTDKKLTAWEQIQLSRHQDRPYTLDYITRLFSSFRPIHGDRKFGDDPALVGGMALFEGQPVMVLGQQKGRNTKDRLYRNYGMAKPEGYRKSIRLMSLAEKFNRPIFTFIDTPGAYPGLGAEARGQAQAIADNLRTMVRLRVPIVVTVLGEGGSGGALAISLGDRVLMLEHSIYSVISPESCSAILWKDQNHVQEAAQALQLTAQDLLRFKLIDEIVPEPTGGAHLNWDEAAANLKMALLRNFKAIRDLGPDERLAARFEKFRSIGDFFE